MFRSFNDWMARRITAVVGTMWCFWFFNGIALVSLPSALKTHSLVPIINWVSSNWIQLILLPALMVGQSMQHKKLDQIHAHLKISGRPVSKTKTRHK